MSSLEEEIAEMKADIKELEVERRAATTEERKDLLNAITAKENRLTEMMRAAGNTPPVTSLRFMCPLTPFSYLFLVLN